MRDELGDDTLGASRLLAAGRRDRWPGADDTRPPVLGRTRALSA